MPTIREGANRASPSEAASYVEEYDRMEQDRENRLAQLDAEFKQKKRDLNKSIDADQKAILEEAKRFGVKKGVIRAIVGGQKRIRKFEEGLEAAKQKASDGIHELESEEQEFAVDIVKALGEDFAGFGLGAAAVKRESDADATASIVAAAEQAWGKDDAKKAKKRSKAQDDTFADAQPEAAE